MALERSDACRWGVGVGRHRYTSRRGSRWAPRSPLRVARCFRDTRRARRPTHRRAGRDVLSRWERSLDRGRQRTEDQLHRQEVACSPVLSSVTRVPSTRLARPTCRARRTSYDLKTCSATINELNTCLVDSATARRHSWVGAARGRCAGGLTAVEGRLHYCERRPRSDGIEGAVRGRVRHAVAWRRRQGRSVERSGPARIDRVARVAALLAVPTANWLTAPSRTLRPRLTWCDRRRLGRPHVRAVVVAVDSRDPWTGGRQTDRADEGTLAYQDAVAPSPLHRAQRPRDHERAPSVERRAT